jgi:hypothetical protein
VEQKSVRLFFALLLCSLAFVPRAAAQSSRKSHEDCRADWPPYFAEGQKEHEAAYWACRLGVATGTVKTWQASPGLIADIQMATINKSEFVFIERSEGTMHCYNFEVLLKTAGGWREVWVDSSDDYCMVHCPAIKMRIVGSQLLLDLPSSSDPDCRRMFVGRKYVWNGKTFRAAATPLHDRKP